MLSEKYRYELFERISIKSQVQCLVSNAVKTSVKLILVRGDANVCQSIDAGSNRMLSKSFESIKPLPNSLIRQVAQ